MSDNENSFLDSNTIMAIVICFAIFLGWQLYMQDKYPNQSKNAAVSEKSLSDSKETTAGVVQANKPSEVKESAPTAKEVVEVASGPDETFLSFSGKNVSFKISSYGMGFTGISLKNYSDRNDNSIRFAQIDDSEMKEVPPSPDVTKLLARGNFSTYYQQKPVVFSLEQTSENTFIGQAKIGEVSFIKEIEFTDETYSASMKLKVEWEGGETAAVQTLLFDQIKNEASTWYRPTYEGTDFFNIAEGSEERERQAVGTPFKANYKNVTLASVGSQYFALSLLDKSEIMPSAISELVADGSYGVAKTSLFHKPGPGQKKLEVVAQTFMGPKNHDLLQNVDPSMGAIVDYGFFGVIAKPILKLLKWLYALFGNWGIAIIGATIIIRTLLLPIAISSVKSMAKMQKIQPILKDIKVRYKDDPQKMNAETMAIMKREGANPLGGCLPMFAQIPVFFALYSVLGQSIELYKSPFAFWIKDLSYQDPYFVLPILVSLLFFLQMKYSPSTMDPNQKKIMMFMPLMFGVFMISMPSGLTLYFVVNTIFGIGQQVLFQPKKAAV